MLIFIPFIFIAAVALAALTIATRLRDWSATGAATSRLMGSIALTTSPGRARATIPAFDVSSNRDRTVVAERRTWRRPLARPLRFLPYLIGCLACAGLLILQWIPPAICVAVSVALTVLLSQIEYAWYEFRVSRIERQLIDLLDMTIPMLRSGAGASTALAMASREIGSPLRDEIQWATQRIELGDQGPAVFRAMSQNIPLDVMELFATTMAVHWGTGGSLAPILTSVSRVARDRQEVSRRIRSNIAQSQFSTIAVLCLIYFVAIILWVDRPEQMREFASTTVGSSAIAATVFMQAIGIVWMNLISRPEA